MESWGKHAILNIRGCEVDKATNPEYLSEFTKELVRRIDMVAFGEPQVVHFGTGQTKLTGYTVLQFIETSNIMAHFMDHNGDAYLDVFSCKEFDPQVVVDLVKEKFNPKNINLHVLYRQA